ncbi:MAG: DUF1835 domain-containing protein [Bryobacteraceae bacterium]
MVHVTNGDAVAEKLRRWAGEPRLIVWRDILHEGPVRAGLSLEELSAERRAWLAANGFGTEDRFTERDRQLRRLVARDSLWLWFEDDLYDQLQLLQVLDFLHHEDLTASPHFIIDIPRTLAVEQMAGLAANKTRVTPQMIDTAVRAWAAFTSPGRAAIPALLETDLSALPHLRPAMERLLQHTPENNRVEQTIVAILANGGQTARQLFERYQETEERPFLGDTTFYWYLNRLAPRVAKDGQGIYRLGSPLLP